MDGREARALFLGARCRLGKPPAVRASGGSLAAKRPPQRSLRSKFWIHDPTACEHSSKWIHSNKMDPSHRFAQKTRKRISSWKSLKMDPSNKIHQNGSIELSVTNHVCTICEYAHASNMPKGRQDLQNGSYNTYYITRYVQSTMYEIIVYTIV